MIKCHLEGEGGAASARNSALSPQERADRSGFHDLETLLCDSVIDSDGSGGGGGGWATYSDEPVSPRIAAHRRIEALKRTYTTLLYDACTGGNVAEVARLLDGRAIRVNTPISITVGTPLLVATNARQTTVMEWLLDHRADPNQPSPPHYNRPLTVAANLGNVGLPSGADGLEMAHLLLRRGADPQQRASGRNRNTTENPARGYCTPPVTSRCRCLLVCDCYLLTRGFP